MKKLFIIMLALAFIAGAGVIQAEAASSSDITITVTFQNVSVSVADSSWGIGVVSTADVKTQAFTATNDGNINEDLDVAVSNSANWTVNSTVGADQFKMDFSTDGGSSWTNLPTTSVVDLVDDLAPGDQAFSLQFSAPSSSTNYDPQSIAVTVSAAVAVP